MSNYGGFEILLAFIELTQYLGSITPDSRLQGLGGGPSGIELQKVASLLG